MNTMKSRRPLDDETNASPRAATRALGFVGLTRDSTSDPRVIAPPSRSCTGTGARLNHRPSVALGQCLRTGQAPHDGDVDAQ